jgi:hypothetical protein
MTSLIKLLVTACVVMSGVIAQDDTNFPDVDVKAADGSKLDCATLMANDPCKKLTEEFKRKLCDDARVLA